jgi:protein-disulfide isomerase
MKLQLLLANILLTGMMATFSYAETKHQEVTDSFNLGSAADRAQITNTRLDNIRKHSINNAEVIFRNEDDAVIGNPEGEITFVAFIDYLCPVSEKLDPMLKSLIKANPDLRIVFKEFPMRGEVSTYAAKAALAANKQGKYQVFHLALMQAGNTLTKEKVLAIAKANNLNLDQLKQDMNSTDIEQHLQSNRLLAYELGLVGTPSLLFARTNVAKGDNKNAIHFMMGKFIQHDLQEAINYVKKQP